VNSSCAARSLGESSGSSSSASGAERIEGHPAGRTAGEYARRVKDRRAVAQAEEGVRWAWLTLARPRMCVG
jgi:hypothetical protein